MSSIEPLSKQLEVQLRSLRYVLAEQLPAQMRSGTVETSEWHRAHQVDAWFSENRYRLPETVAVEFEELLRWYLGATNAFLDWMRAMVSQQQHNDSDTLVELRSRIESLWLEYDRRARKVMNLAEDQKGRDGVSGDHPRTRILFLASNPTTTSALDLEEELRSLQTELRGVRYRDDIALIPRHAVRPDDLVRYLRQDQPTIVHFSGHGSTSGIVLRTEDGHTLVSGRALQRLFRERGVELAVLNACFSNEQAESLMEVIPAVVGTTHAVGDIAARRFSTAFYRTLGDGHSVDDAFRDGGDAVAVHELEDVFKAYGDLGRAVVGVRAA